jgi:hypothetical protein
MVMEGSGSAHGNSIDSTLALVSSTKKKNCTSSSMYVQRLLINKKSFRSLSLLQSYLSLRQSATDHTFR